jgi:acyl carrier protein
LSSLLHHDSPQIGVMRVDWKMWAKIYPSYTRSPLLSDVMRSVTDTGVPEQPAQQTYIRESLLGAESTARLQIVANELHQQVARTLRLPPGKLDASRSLTTMGLDSLMAVELRNRIQKTFGVTVPIVTLLRGPSVADLSNRILESIIASVVLHSEEETPPEHQAENDWEILKL